VWTEHISQPLSAKPKLPDWLSVPVLVGILPTIAILLYVLEGTRPMPVLLGLVPVAIVFPSLMWLDRVEPEPFGARVHAVLWGAFVAGVISGIVNTIVGSVSSEIFVVTVSAPLVEEATKAAGILWAVKRRYVDGPMDGIVYAGWVALGFAVVEDMLYFSLADSQGALVSTFVLRAVLTPFAHPLFTVWTGLAIGLAISRQKAVLPYALGGYVLAVGAHATWNGSLAFAATTNDPSAALLAALFFMILFISTTIALANFRSRQLRRFAAMVPFLADRYGLSPNEVLVFTDYRQMLQARKSVHRSSRPQFDAMHSALARLALLHQRPGTVDRADQARLAHQLHQARHFKSR